MAHAAEWGHWYDREGKPVYEVPYADPSKGMRAVTLADARKMNLVPSVTTIIREAAKPGLERWKQEQVLMAALTLPRIDGELEADWISRVFQDSQEQARKAAEKGTAIHAAIQGFYEHETTTRELMPYVTATAEAIEKAFPAISAWQAEASFTSIIGFGGKTDLCKDNGEDRVVIDFKTKEFANTEKKLAWDEHCIQLAAYRRGLGVPNAVCCNVFVSVNNPGLVHIHEWKEGELQRGWMMFAALLDYWYAKTGLKR